MTSPCLRKLVLCALLPFTLAAAAAAAPLERKVGKLTVKISLNNEVMYALLNLSDAGAKLRTGRETPPMHEKVLEAFAGLKDHPAVRELGSEGRLHYFSGFAESAFATSATRSRLAMPSRRRISPVP